MNRFGLYILALQSLQALGVQAASGVYKVEDCGANSESSGRKSEFNTVDSYPVTSSAR